MNEDTVYERLCDLWGDIINDLYADWCQEHNIETDDETAYDAFICSDEYAGVTRFIQELE